MKRIKVLPAGAPAVRRGRLKSFNRYKGCDLDALNGIFLEVAAY